MISRTMPLVFLGFGSVPWRTVFAIMTVSCPADYLRTSNDPGSTLPA